MKTTYRSPSPAVVAGTEAGLRHLNRVYVAKVNAMIAADRTDVAQELAAEHAVLVGDPLDETDHRVGPRRSLRRIFAA